MCDLSVTLTSRQRAVRKGTHYETYWYDARYWDGIVNNEDEREPLELSCHVAMAGATGGTVVTPKLDIDDFQTRQTLVDKTLKHYRLYTEWCGHGKSKG